MEWIYLCFVIFLFALAISDNSLLVDLRLTACFFRISRLACFVSTILVLAFACSETSALGFIAV